MLRCRSSEDAADVVAQTLRNNPNATRGRSEPNKDATTLTPRETSLYAELPVSNHHRIGTRRRADASKTQQRSLSGRSAGAQLFCAWPRRFCCETADQKYQTTPIRTRRSREDADRRLSPVCDVSVRPQPLAAALGCRAAASRIEPWSAVLLTDAPTRQSGKSPKVTFQNARRVHAFSQSSNATPLSRAPPHLAVPLVGCNGMSGSPSAYSIITRETSFAARKTRALLRLFPYLRANLTLRMRRDRKHAQAREKWRLHSVLAGASARSSEPV